MQTLRLLKTPAARAIFNRSKTSFYADVSAGLLTPPVKIGDRSVAWVEAELQAVANARVAGFDDSKIKTLVRELIKKRSDLAPILVGQK